MHHMQTRWTQVTSCSRQPVTIHNAQLENAPLLLRWRAYSATFLTAFPARQISSCASSSTSGLVVDIQPTYGVHSSPPGDADERTTTAVDSASATQAETESPVVHSSRNESSLDRRKLWFAAIKPPMYSVGFIPVLVAAASVFFQFGVLPWTRAAGFVLAAVLVIAWLNLSNDAFDAQTGVDASKPESVVNLLGGGSKSRTRVLLLAMSLLVAGVALLAQLITSVPGGDLRPAGLLAASIACGYIYQGPPFRLSYKGLGEPLCFFAFGPSALTAFYLALRPDGGSAATATVGDSFVSTLTAGVPQIVWIISVMVGFTTTVILFCSHFHQIAGDTAAGKRSPLVRLGTERGRKVLRAAVVATHSAALAAVATGIMPWVVAAATLLAVPAARTMVAFADENHLVPERVAPLKRFAVTWHIQYGVCLCLGLAAARMLAAGV